MQQNMCFNVHSDLNQASEPLCHAYWPFFSKIALQPDEASTPVTSRTCLQIMCSFQNERILPAFQMILLEAYQIWPQYCRKNQLIIIHKIMHNDPLGITAKPVHICAKVMFRPLGTSNIHVRIDIY